MSACTHQRILFAKIGVDTTKNRPRKVLITGTLPKAPMAVHELLGREVVVLREVLREDLDVVLPELSVLLEVRQRRVQRRKDNLEALEKGQHLRGDNTREKRE